MSDYTPTAEEVRLTYAALQTTREHFRRKSNEVAYAEFDRWLTAHDAEVLEKAVQRIIENCIREHNVASCEVEYEGHRWNDDEICNECETCVAAARGDGEQE